ncbi:MAG: leucine-rich repeat protein [Prevotella sp.]|nr:leucine-rich repeat protein [Prevotella sp.]
MNNILRFNNDGKTLEEITDKSVTNIIVPDGVTTIGDYAFSGCTSLKSLG